MPRGDELLSPARALTGSVRRAGRRLRRLSLRARILAGVLVLVTVGLVVSDAAAATALRSYLIGRVDQQLSTAALRPRLLVRELNGPGAAQVLGGTAAYAALLVNGERRLSLTLPPPGQPSPPPPRLPARLLRGGGPSTVRAVAGGGTWRAVAEPVRQGTLVLATSLSGINATVGRLEAVEALVTVAILALVALVSRWLVRVGLRPLDEMGRTAGAIAAGDLSQRVEEANPATEVGRLGLALNAMLARIEEAFAAQRESEDRLRRFVGDASHELRTPLTSIRGYAELFRRGASEHPEDLALAMRRIEDESLRMGSLVDDLLLLARLDQGRPLERERVDLAVVAAARVADPARPISLQAPSEVPVVGDEGRLHQVATNLLANARQHTPAGTPVAVSARLDGDRALLEVSDRGPGLSASDAARVFERFYRADSSRVRGQGGGAGLGLSIVAAITEAHGGSVSVDTEPGRGATFRVALPALAVGPDDQGPSRPLPPSAVR